MDGEERPEDQQVAIEARGQAPDMKTGAVPCARESAPEKRPRGRPKGSVNKVNKIAKEAITEAAPHAFLIRVMEGRVFKRAVVEDGRRTVPVRPTLTQSVTAAETLLRKISPDMRAVELTGDPERPVAVPWSDPELGRRVALILSQNVKAADEQTLGGRKGRPTAGVGARTGGTSSTPAAAPAPAFSHNAPETRDGAAEGYHPTATGDAHHGATSRDGEATEAKPQVPTPPPVGSMLRFSSNNWVIAACPPDRNGLPVIYELRNGAGLVRRGRFDVCLGLLRKQLGDGDLGICTIYKPTPDFFPSQPDQRPPAPERPQVLRRRPRGGE